MSDTYSTSTSSWVMTGMTFGRAARLVGISEGWRIFAYFTDWGAWALSINEKGGDGVVWFKQGVVARGYSASVQTSVLPSFLSSRCSYNGGTQ